jgi:hypothetical protein
MSNPLPEGEDLRRAIKWILTNLQEQPNEPVRPMIEEAIFKFDLSPKDGEFLVNFFKKK